MLITGVGIAASIFSLMKQLHLKKYDRVYQVGIAGTYDDSISIGSAFLVQSDCFADLGVMEKGIWKTIHELGFSDPDEYPFTDNRLINPHLPTIDLPKASGATVQRLTDNDVEIETLRNAHGAEVESMEGAALHYVALQLNIPFYQIRGISNRVGIRNKSQWKIQEAIDSACNLFLTLENTFRHS
jgi:futalosine hydrolase